MTIFLTGASGFLGKHLSRMLLILGHDVVTDMRWFDNAKWDLIIHLASVTTISTEFNPWMFESNIVFAKKIMSTPHKTIYASSCSARHLTNPYSYTKRYLEHLGEIHGNAVGLRLFNCYGPQNNKGIVRHLLSLSDGAKLNVRGPDQIRDYIHIESVVSAICNSDIWMPGVHDIGTGVGTSTMDLVNLFQKLSGRQFDISVSDPGDNEPPSMISNNIVPHISLEDGLKKLINGSI